VEHPAIILPTGALAQLQPAAVDALLAHELAHVARGDYGANLVQSILEVLLFFSPPARWLSARVREAREFCCDDAAVAQCGGAERYAKALAAVAALGSSHRRLALGAAGPRLIVRIRRLLREDAMTKYAGLRIGAIGAALAAVLWTGSIVTAASLERTAAAWRQSGTAGSGPGGIPVEFVPSQPGAAVTIEAVTSTADALCGALTVRNPTDVDVIGLTFAAIVEQRGTPNVRPVQTATRGRDAAVPAGGTAIIQADLLSADEAGAGLPGPVQVMCALSSVRFANGWSWQVTLNPAATRADAALSLPPTEVDPSLVRPPPTAASAPGQAASCRDEQGRLSSEGAVIPVRGKPGRLARCSSGQWVELPFERPRGAAPVTSPPVPVKQVQPDGRVALQLRQGTVLVAITVDRNGGVSAARVVKSLSPELDAKALRAARQWLFTPGRRDGQPVAVETQLEMTFMLR
jgi:TonB family protein